MVLAVWAIGLVVLGTAIFRDRSMASALEGRWPQFGLRAMFAMTALIGLMIFARQNQTLNEQWRKQAESLQSKNATLEAQNKNLELRLKSANDLLRAQSKRLQAQSKRPNPPSSPTIASPPPSDQESP